MVLLITILLALVISHPHGVFSVAVSNNTYIRCGDPVPTSDFLATAEALYNLNERRDLVERQSISVDTYFHVVTSAARNGSVTVTQLNSQLAVLNRSYNPYGITFNLIDTDFTVDNNWATGQYDSEMKPALRKGTYEDLNVYFLTDLQPAALLGMCPFPAGQLGPGDSVFDLDGCKIRSTTVPGGSLINYNQGMTLTHEVGHCEYKILVVSPRRSQILLD
ncbi:hypothetical protein MMC25_006726 [Agyrium rufum]|nr:hypothetical protein [Agyrium rufum]